ncbi:MAG: hypothetical protein R3D80_19990 [Paracoccaceae bacterium]
MPVDLFTEDPAAAAGVFDAVHRIADPHRAPARLRRGLQFATPCSSMPTRWCWPARRSLRGARPHRPCPRPRRAPRDAARAPADPRPCAFPQLSSGVVLYRRTSRMLAFLAEWARRFAASGGHATSRFWCSGVGSEFWVLPPEFNLRRQLLDAWEPGDCRRSCIRTV